MAGCFIFPRLYLTSVRFLRRIMRSDPTREDGYWWLQETQHMRTACLVRDVHRCLSALSISFSLLLCDYKTKLCRCSTRFIEFGPFRASLTKIAASSLFSPYGFLHCLKNCLRQKDLGDGIYRTFEYIVSLVSCEPWILCSRNPLASTSPCIMNSVPRFAVPPSVLD